MAPTFAPRLVGVTTTSHDVGRVGVDLLEDDGVRARYVAMSAVSRRVRRLRLRHRQRARGQPDRARGRHDVDRAWMSGIGAFISTGQRGRAKAHRTSTLLYALFAGHEASE